MKIRITWGNVLALPAIAVGIIKEVAPDVIAISPALGQKFLMIGAIAALISKGIASFNSHTILGAKKITAGPVFLEKTGPFKPEGI